MTHSAIILSAGLSQRMGQDKALLPWLDGQSLLEWTVEAFVQTGWRPVVVLGPHNHPQWGGRCPGAQLVLNPKPSEGKTTSIAAGLAAVQMADAILITSIDQPRPRELYRRLREVEFSKPILACDKNGRNGHPLVFKGNLKTPLSTLSESEEGLRGFLQKHHDSIHRMPCPPDWLRWDLNTPEAYAEALEWFKREA